MRLDPTRPVASKVGTDAVLARMFAATAVVALVAFAVWFLVIKGPLPSLAPQ